MTSETPSPPQEPRSPAEVASPHVWRRGLGCAALAAVAAAAGGVGTGLGFGIAALAVLACAVLAAAAPGRASPATGVLSDDPDATQGARVMGREIVPVWRRHLAASRDEADRGVNGLLQHFSSLSDALNDAVAAAEGHAALRVASVSGDELIERHPQALSALLDPLRRLRAERRSVTALLREVEAGQQAIERSAAELGRLARHIGLVAMNAAIEANRSSAAKDGFQSVAAEVRDVAGDLQACSTGLATHLGGMGERVRALRQATELADESDEALEIESRVRAREVIERLVQELGSALEQSRRLRETSQQLRDDLDGVFVGFQFQDRLNQMLGSLQDDMDRFEAWLREPAARTATHEDAAAWLRRLETTYTMQEQHAFHHGNAEIRKSASVEFF